MMMSTITMIMGSTHLLLKTTILGKILSSSSICIARCPQSYHLFWLKNRCAPNENQLSDQFLYLLAIVKLGVRIQTYLQLDIFSWLKMCVIIRYCIRFKWKFQFLCWLKFLWFSIFRLCVCVCMDMRVCVCACVMSFLQSFVSFLCAFMRSFLLRCFFCFLCRFHFLTSSFVHFLETIFC